MPRMLKELQKRPELGLLHYEIWGGEPPWFSVAFHRAAPRLRHEQAGTSTPGGRSIGRWHHGAVGIWHETYCVAAGSYENVYVNMPEFGFAKQVVCSPQQATAIGCGAGPAFSIRPDLALVRSSVRRRRPL
jgi:hypothetical protein